MVYLSENMRQMEESLENHPVMMFFLFFFNIFHKGKAKVFYPNKEQCVLVEVLAHIVNGPQPVVVSVRLILATL